MVEVISTGVSLVVKLVIVVVVDGLVETVVVVLVVVVGLFVVFLARQQRQGPCPGNGSHLPALQLSSSTTMSFLASWLIHTHVAWQGGAVDVLAVLAADTRDLKTWWECSWSWFTYYRREQSGW